MLDPHDDDSDEDEGMIVPRALVVARGNAPELLEPVDCAFDAIALPIQGFVELRATTRTM